MRFGIIVIFGLVIFWLLSSFSSQHQLRVLSFDDFEPHLHFKNDTTYVINFWATWCAPCVEEIPAFEKINREYSGKKLRLILVSLDMPEQIESRLIPFLEKHDVSVEVLVLDDPDSNSWIDKVDPSWTGGIPATLVYNNKFRSFYERSFTYDELKQIVKQKID